MNNSIPINPAILLWARETAGLTVAQVAAKLHSKSITAETVVSWESGKLSPSYIQLEKLAYQVYKRPLALFFFPEPPVEVTPTQAFRTLPQHEIERLSPRMRFLLRHAKSMQLNLTELYNGDNPAPNQIIRDLKFTTAVPITEMTKAVRKYLNVDLSQQMQWESAQLAFKSWRTAFEACGVFVFKEAFKDDVFSGFCLYDDRFPLIYVNNSKPETRQVFTLFHELFHLLSGTGGVDKTLEDYIRFLEGDNKSIEVSCNRFAGAFLVPDDDFDQRIKNLAINENTVKELAHCYSVSREAVLRKFYDRKLISQQFYEQKVEEWKKERIKSGKGGDYYRNQGAYLGESYIKLVFSRLYQNRISIEQVAAYLGVKVKNVPGIEALLFPKGIAA